MRKWGNERRLSCGINQHVLGGLVNFCFPPWRRR